MLKGWLIGFEIIGGRYEGNIKKRIVVEPAINQPHALGLAIMIRTAEDYANRLLSGKRFVRAVLYVL